MAQSPYEGIYFIGEREKEKVQRAEDFCREVRSMQSGVTQPKALPEIRNYTTMLLPNKNQFEALLSVYESNQDYYLSLYDKGQTEEAIRALIDLEDRFTTQVEPCPIIGVEKNCLLFYKASAEVKTKYREWYAREKDKFERGISFYCPERVAELICPYELSTSKNRETKKRNWERILAFPH